MKEFTYRVKAEDGSVKDGTVWAESKEEALARLHSQFDLILSLGESSTSSRGANHKWKAKQVILLAYQMELLLSAGLPLRRILELLSRKKGKIPYESLAAAIQRGESLSEGLKNLGYPPLAIALIEAGEAAGTLEASFGLIKVYYERQEKYRKKVLGMISYPIFLTVLMVAFFLVTMLVIVPNFKQVFSSMHVAVPLMTQVLFTLSDGLRHYYGQISLVVIALIGGFIACLRQKPVRQAIDRWLWKEGRRWEWLTAIQYMNLLHVWAILLDSGISLIEALQLTGNLWNNSYAKGQSLHMLDTLRQGQSFSQGLKDSDLGTSFIWDMVTIGEESGEMVAMMKHCSHYYEQVLEAHMQVVERLMEPVLLSVMGIGVGILVSAVMVPLFNAVSSLE